MDVYVHESARHGYGWMGAHAHQVFNSEEWELQKDRLLILPIVGEEHQRPVRHDHVGVRTTAEACALHGRVGGEPFFQGDDLAVPNALKSLTGEFAERPDMARSCVHLLRISQSVKVVYERISAHVVLPD